MPIDWNDDASVVRAAKPGAFEEADDAGIYIPVGQYMREWVGTDWHDARTKHPTVVAFEAANRPAQAPAKEVTYCPHGVQMSGTCIQCFPSAQAPGCKNPTAPCECFTKSPAQCPCKCEFCAGRREERVEAAGMVFPESTYSRYGKQELNGEIKRQYVFRCGGSGLTKTPPCGFELIVPGDESFRGHSGPDSCPSCHNSIGIVRLEWVLQASVVNAGWENRPIREAAGDGFEYVLRPQPSIRAVKWTGDNLAQVQEVYPMLGEEYMRDKGCRVGDYVISHRAGQVYFMHPDTFEKSYMAA